MGPIIYTMAGSANPHEFRDLSRSPNDPRGPETEIEVAGNKIPVARDEIREAAARLYGQGYERKQIAKILLDHLAPNKEFEDGTPRPKEQRMSTARAKLRKWEADEKFRDIIYQTSLVKLDLQTPAILGGIAKKAKRGRVDAARLALELTGRHNPKGDDKPAQIVVAIAGIARPQGTQAVEADLELEQAEDGTFQVVE